LGKKSISLILLLYISLPLTLFAISDQEKDFKILTSDFHKIEEEAFEKKAFAFIKKYPSSNYIPDAKLMLALKTSDCELAAERYRYVAYQFPSYKDSDLALLRLCQILDLQSKWKELEIHSKNGIKKYSSGRYGINFYLMHIQSLIMMEDYGNAKKEALHITELSHDIETLSRALLLLSEIERKTYGNSRAYVYSLREIITGFDKSQIYPAALFCLASFYEGVREFDKSYSAYSDIVKLFPESPEADLSLQKIERLKLKNPKIVSYLPSDESIKKTSVIDIKPEQQIDEENEGNFFAISIGPFNKKKDSESIARILKNYPTHNIIQTATGYYIIMGNFTDTDGAMNTKIRLAQEHGINGALVKISKNNGKTYIYGD